MSGRRDSGLRMLGRAYLTVCFLFLLAPILTLIIFSFQRNQYASIPGQGWSLRWYEKLLADGSLLEALKNSLVVSPLAASGATVIGFLAAYAVHRWQFRGRTALAVLIATPMLVPALLLGIGFLGLLTRLGIAGHWGSVVVSHIVLVTAPAMALIQLRLGQMPKSLEEAAWNLGASEWQSLLRVVLPFAIPGLAGGWLLAFTFSFDEFVIAWFVCGFQPTLPVAVYASIVGSADPSLNAMAAIIFLISCGMLLLAELVLAPVLFRARDDQQTGS